MIIPGPVVQFSTQRVTATLDADNGVINTYNNNLSGITASLQYQDGSELNSLVGINAIQTANFYVDYGADITVTDRIIYNSRVFDVKAVLNRFNSFLKVIAVEVFPSTVL